MTTPPRPDGAQRYLEGVEALALRATTLANAAAWLLEALARDEEAAARFGLDSNNPQTPVAQAAAAVADEVIAVTEGADLLRASAADRIVETALLGAYRAAPTPEARAAVLRVEAVLVVHPGPPERADDWRQAMRAAASKLAARGDVVGLGQLAASLESDAKQTKGAVS